MNSKRVSFIIDAQDNASKKFRQVKQEASALDKSFSILGGTVAAAAQLITVAAGAISLAGVFSLKTAGQLEAAEQGFKALLGTAEKARETMARIKKEAAATPFELTGLVAGTQALAAITKDGNKAIDTLLDVGKAISTSGKGQAELDSVIANLQQVASTGVVTEMDIRQFQRAIPIFNDILAASGLTTEELKNSKDSAKLLFDAFKKAGQEGGITAAGFAAQAGAFDQLWSNVEDTLTITGSEFVKQTGLFDAAKRVMTEFINYIGQHQRDIINFGVSMVQAFKDGRQAVYDVIEYVKSLFAETSILYQFLKITLGPTFVELKETAINAWNSIIEALKPIMPELKMVATVLGVVIVGAILAVIVGFAKLVQAVIVTVDYIISAFSGLIKFLKVGMENMFLTFFALLAAFKGDWKTVGEIIKTIFKGSLDYAKGLLETFVNFFVRQINKAIDSINKIPGVDIGKIKNFSVDGKATGGQVQSGTPYIVGERGPEFFVPSSSGTIIPNSKLGGGTTFNFTFNGDVNDSQRLISMVKQAVNRELELSRYGIA